MSRKSRKRKRKQKPINLNDPKTKRVIWRIARYLTRLPRDDRNVNKLSYCPKCQQFYCEGFTHIDAYCRDCFYKRGCDKTFWEERICKRCQKDARNAITASK